MGIEPHIDLWNYFSRARLWPGMDAEAVVWGSTNIFVWSGSGVDLYFHFPMSDPPAGWRKVRFFFRNNADEPLPIFTGAAPSLNLNGGTVWLINTSVGYNPCVMSSGSCYEVS
jgi:hypothetical protein